MSSNHPARGGLRSSDVCVQIMESPERVEIVPRAAESGASGWSILNRLAKTRFVLLEPLSKHKREQPMFTTQRERWAEPQIIAIVELNT